MEKGFTLVELLVTLTIIGILVIILITIIKPQEIMKQVRDTERLGNLYKLQKIITVLSEKGSTDVLCRGDDPRPCQSDSITGSQSIDGTGWIRANLSENDIFIMPVLPIDRINNSNFKYIYSADDRNKNDWEIDVRLESEKFRELEDWDGKDGGDDPDLYEIGTNLRLVSP